mmetsp:Transcript_108160/g.150929  ORF Transcript_108160/g.150929 Transcript_108160/m.150929 type:complete len:96 (-) Transcript_108160:555-842(-)
MAWYCTPGSSTQKRLNPKEQAGLLLSLIFGATESQRSKRLVLLHWMRSDATNVECGRSVLDFLLVNFHAPERNGRSTPLQVHVSPGLGSRTLRQA